MPAPWEPAWDGASRRRFAVGATETQSPELEGTNMRKLLGLGICLALAACAGQPVKKPAKCEGPMRPANPHGLTLHPIPDQAAQTRAPEPVNVIQKGAPATQD